MNSPCIINFVCCKVFTLGVLFLYRRRFQLPVIQTMKKHLGQVMHDLPFSLWKVPKFIKHKVEDSLEDFTMKEDKKQKVFTRMQHHLMFNNMYSIHLHLH